MHIKFYYNTNFFTMKQVIFKFVFNRRYKLRDDNKGLIELYIYRNYKKKYFSTGIYIHPKEWTGKRPTWVNIPMNDKGRVYNKFLSNMIDNLEKQDFKQLEQNKNITDEQINAIIRGIQIVDISLIDFMRETVNNRNDIQISTKKVTLSTINKLEKFGIINFNDLTVENILNMQNNLLQEVSMARAHKIHAILKTYINIAIKYEILPYDKNPYLKINIPKGKSTERRYLTKEELKLLEDKKITIKRVEIVKDMFLFSCYTGLAYSDMQNLKPENIIVENNTEFIKIYRSKTEEKAIVFLFDKPREILNKYKGDVYCFPRISNQRLNSYLKEIQDLCGISKTLTTHVARHTFATTVLLSNNVPIEVVSKALGHSDIKTTQIYAKVVNSQIAEQMSRIEDKLNN